MTKALFPTAPVPLAAQIAEIERELAMRSHAYPRFIANGRLKQEAADKQIAALRAALRTLQGIAEAPREPRPSCRADEFQYESVAAEIRERGHDFDRPAGML